MRPPADAGPAAAHGFAARLLEWHALHGRRDLPWVGARDPYRVWLSEVMLQQTRAATVVAYYERFLARFPTVRALAAAAPADVLQACAGLGYYGRARNLHACAQVVVRDHGGRFPRTAEALAMLPGIGRTTAAAIAAFCFDERVAILDGNVKRVLARHFAIDGYPGTAAVERRLWERAAALLPACAADMPAYTQAVMDLGALVCTRRAPRCDHCPVRANCLARRGGTVEQLPTPRPRRLVPQRSALWLLLVDDGRVLLERRPGAGIWGGLLAPPAFDRAEDLQAAARLHGAAGPPRPWPQRRHAFTHFTLHFTPYLAHVCPAAAAAREPGAEWLPLARAGEAALPAPVRVLLEELRAAPGGGTVT